MEIINFEKGISKNNITFASQRTVDEVKNGDLNPLEIYIRSKAYIQYFTDVAKNIQNDVIEEIEKYGKGDSVLSCKIEVTNTGDRLNYESDEVYADLKKQLKEREELLKTAFKSNATLVDEDGLEIPKVPIKTHSSQAPKITIPNE